MSTMTPIFQHQATRSINSRCFALFPQQHKKLFETSLRAWYLCRIYIFSSSMIPQQSLQLKWQQPQQRLVRHSSSSAETEHSDKTSRKRTRGPHMTPSSSMTPTAHSSVCSSNAVSNSSLNSSDHLINRIISGGTPCDPAPPPFRLANFGEDSLYTLVLLRHGESEWNLQNKYTGWCDVALTPKGKQEARAAGRLLYENGIQIDHAFTSVLKRASFSCNMALNTAQQHWVPVTKTWRLNERHYGRHVVSLLV
jgi:Histidine phosphatase superfamily (branch 1)